MSNNLIKMKYNLSKLDESDGSPNFFIRSSFYELLKFNSVKYHTNYEAFQFFIVEFHLILS